MSSEFVEEIQDQFATWVNCGAPDRREVSFDVSTCEGPRDTVCLDRIEVPRGLRGKGYARELLTLLCSNADLKRVVLVLTALPIEDVNDVDRAQSGERTEADREAEMAGRLKRLLDIYSKNGFVATECAVHMTKMIRSPRAY